MKRLIMISYHFPPLGGVAVMRCLRFTRYLHEFGWKPLVVCVDGGGNEPTDPQLLDELHPSTEVYRVPCVEPDNYCNDWSKPGQKIVRNLFKTFDFILFPDDRALWIEPASRTAAHLARRHQARAIFATAQPWSSLVAAEKAAAETGLPLVLDFRDDWTTSNADFRRRRPQRQAREVELEAKILSRASQVISVTPPIVQALNARRPDPMSPAQFHYLPNGFDPEHFPLDKPKEPNKKFTILHAGGIWEKRPPAMLLEGLERWFESHPGRRGQVQVRLAGRVAAGLEEAFTPFPEVELCGFLPHRQVRRSMLEADLLLLMLERVETAEWLFTGKVFEYIGAARPILMIGPTRGALAEIVRQSGVGQVVADHQPEQLAATLEELFQHRHQPPAVDEEARALYDARNQTARLVEILEAAGG